MSCHCFFFFNDTATTEIYTLSLHDALPISRLSFSTDSLSSEVPPVLTTHPVKNKMHTHKISAYFLIMVTQLEIIFKEFLHLVKRYNIHFVIQACVICTRYNTQFFIRPEERRVG